MHREDDFSDHMTLGEVLMRLTGLGERIAFRDRNLELRPMHRLVEALEFANSGDAVITDQFHAAPFLRRRLNTIGMRNTPARPKRVQTLLQRISAGERHRGSRAARREAVGANVAIGAVGTSD